MKATPSILTSILALAVVGTLMGARPAVAADAETINAEAEAALKVLYATTPAAKALAPKAKAILVFPNVVKAGFIVGAQYGTGALFEGGKPTTHYSLKAASYGLQAGVQSFGYAMFLMSDSARRYLDTSAGWELGAGPSIVVMDEGMAKSLSTSTIKDDVYAFTFGQTGLMAGLGLQGSKITKIQR
jgi:lipid-binding SYLF domain-containing protein